MKTPNERFGSFLSRYGFITCCRLWDGKRLLLLWIKCVVCRWGLCGEVLDKAIVAQGSKAYNIQKPFFQDRIRCYLYRTGA